MSNSNHQNPIIISWQKPYPLYHKFDHMLSAQATSNLNQARDWYQFQIIFYLYISHFRLMIRMVLFSFVLCLQFQTIGWPFYHLFRSLIDHGPLPHQSQSSEQSKMISTAHHSTTSTTRPLTPEEEIAIRVQTSIIDLRNSSCSSSSSASTSDSSVPSEVSSDSLVQDIVTKLSSTQSIIPGPLPQDRLYSYEKSIPTGAFYFLYIIYILSQINPNTRICHSARFMPFKRALQRLSFQL